MTFRLLAPRFAQTEAVDLRAMSDGELRTAWTVHVRRAATPPNQKSDVRWLETGLDFATDAIRRTLGLELYPQQRAAARALTNGRIVELETGEGKTVVAAAAAIALAPQRHSTHIITSNQYLAQRDAALLCPAYRLLGLSTAVLPAGPDLDAKRRLYGVDILYATLPELGFDLLRDEYHHRSQPPVRLGSATLSRLSGDSCLGASAASARLPRPDLALVDEADHVLLDEAVSPLVLAGEAGLAADANVALAAHRIASALSTPRDFTVDPATSSIALTPSGRDVVSSARPHGERFLRPWTDYVSQALYAACCLRRDEHYLVEDDDVVLLDRGTGRRLSGHRWQDGLHLAVLIREQRPPRGDGLALASISRPALLSRYRQVLGLTGTASSATHEFRSLYGLQVSVIPPHVACRRQVEPQRVFATTRAKETALVDDVVQRHHTGQPQLVGTRTIDSAERIASALAERGLSSELLTGRDEAREAEIIARAGDVGAITVATNVAGRGTDIRVSPAALTVGGLHVLVAERQQSARIDRQFIGRAARQGHPGSARFYVSAEDWLLAQFAPRLAAWIASRAGANGELDPACASALTTSIQQIQARAETLSARARKELFAADLARRDLAHTLPNGLRRSLERRLPPSIHVSSGV
jgi:preprotein translocase subunit SecA